MLPDLYQVRRSVYVNIGKTIATRWENAGREPNALSAVTEEVLLAQQPWLAFDRLSELTIPMGDSEFDCLQFRTSFGDLQITVYRDDHLMLELLFWTNGTTTIHDHAFAGAFAIMDGASVHTCFAFDNAVKFDEFLTFGKLRVVETEVLKVGDVRAIRFGPQFIHSAFHLPSPTITLVARSTKALSSAPQCNYRQPGLALSTRRPLAGVEKQIDMLRVLVDIAPEDAQRTLLTLIETGTPRLLLEIFETISWSRLDSTIRHEAEDRLLRRPFGQALLDGIKDQLLTRRLLQLRARTSDPDLRLTLGVLANSRGRSMAATALGLAQSERRKVVVAHLATICELDPTLLRLEETDHAWANNLLAGLPLGPAKSPAFRRLLSHSLIGTALRLDIAHPSEKGG